MTALVLCAAILSGVTGTVLTRASDGFSRRRPAVGAVLAYALATLCLAHLLTRMDTGVVYAVWTGSATVILLLLDRLAYAVRVTRVQLVGTVVTVVGVVLLVRGQA